jgi:hypothetical protein
VECVCVWCGAGRRVQHPVVDFRCLVRELVLPHAIVERSEFSCREKVEALQHAASGRN